MNYISEDSSYSDGTLGFPTNTASCGIENTDWYAPGDARIPMGGAVYTRNGRLKKKKKRKKK